MLQIYLYGDVESGWLDLSPGSTLQMETLYDLFDEELSTGVFSLPIEIPWTENNRRLMGFAERIENFKQSKTFWTIDTYDTGFPEIIRSKLTILDKTGNLSYKKGNFNASISGTKGLFGSILKNKKLRDLQLGGKIVFADTSSRGFATRLMKNGDPNYPYIGFAPVAIESFFDTNKDYTDEFIERDTVNDIVYDPGGPGADDWFFGRPASTDPTHAVNAGEAEYIDFRTVPFLKFKYVLIKAFEELGYTVSGEIVDNADFDDLFIFNNQSIDFFSTAVYLDYNRTINPTDHVPDIMLLDFFKRIFSFFNVYPVIGPTHVELKYRTRVFTEKKIVDITKYCHPDFKSTFQEVTTDVGYAVKYTWDGNDSYRDDRVKDEAAFATKTLVATVSTFAQLGTLDIGRDFTIDDMVYVESENMYYIPADATVTPVVLWDAWSEGLDDYKKDNGDRSVELGVGTLCTYVQFDDTAGLYIAKRKCGCRMTGSYWTNTLKQVKSPFGLSLFYIKKTIIDGKNIPVSYNHNTAPTGTVMENFSLALTPMKGMVPTFHKDWQDLQERNEFVKITLNADKKIIAEIEAANILQIQNIQFIPKKKDSTIPLQGTIDMEIVPI